MFEKMWIGDIHISDQNLLQNLSTIAIHNFLGVSLIEQIRSRPAKDQAVRFL